jgi:prepilin-type N-terminal cleavage/methylation domain-containing protein
MNSIITKMSKTVSDSVHREDGYTLIEVLVALIILFIVLVPVTQLIGFLISNPQNMDNINATMLAEREMELCISDLSIESNQRIESVNGKEYHVTTNIDKEDNTVTIIIEVRSRIKNRLLIRLQTLRISDE